MRQTSSCLDLKLPVLALDKKKLQALMIVKGFGHVLVKAVVQVVELAPEFVIIGSFLV